MFDHKNPYSPPGVYTETNFETSSSVTLRNVNIPMLIGPGNETLTNSIEVVRGSSSTVDQRIVLEDMSGRAVMADESLGDFDESARFVKVRNFPIVTGEGLGKSSTSASDVVAFINNEPIVVLSVDGDKGVVELATSPKVTDEVRVSYFFNRTDTALTDDVSVQVSAGAASLSGSASGPFSITANNNEFLLTVDGGDEVALELNPRDEAYSIDQVAAEFNAADVGVTAEVISNNEGVNVLKLSAGQSLSVGIGTMNSEIGFSAGQASSRNAKFMVKHVPIVVGDNSGTTTTDPSHVSATVDGVAVAVVEVDGANGAVTLATPPAEGATVVVSYFWNSFQDTFDYLANIGVQEITSVGISRGVKSYVNGTDFVLKDDKIVWGTSWNLSVGTSTSGSAPFGENQVYAQLVDAKCYMKECSSVTDTSVSPPVTSSRTFRLPYVATTGNGVGNEITLEEYRIASNSRRDLPTNRPELVKAYWGYSVQDAMDRGEVTVVSVDGAGALVTLAEDVPVGATVYATQYHSLMMDTGNNPFVIEASLAGSSGTGTYTITSPMGATVPVAVYSGKGATMVDTVQFPSGNETQPRAFHMGGTPVEEDVTITFADKDASPAEWSLSGVAPFFFVEGASQELDLEVNAGGYNSGITLTDAFQASLVGDKVSYDAATDNMTWTLANDEEIALEVDGAVIEATVAAAGGIDLDDFADAINTAANLVPVSFTGKARFAAWTAVLNEFDDFELTWTRPSGATAISGTITAGAYGTPTTLAAEIQTQIDAAIGVLALGPDDTPEITVVSNAMGQLVLSFKGATNDLASTLQCTGAEGGGNFWSIAGFDTSAGESTALVCGPIAMVSSITGDHGKLNDRLVLRNRIRPVGASLHQECIDSQCYVEVTSGTNLERLGLSVGDQAVGACNATIIPASVSGNISWSEGQDAGWPVVKFFDGTEPGNTQNDVLVFNFDGTPVAVDFTSSGAGTETAMGPAGDATSVMGQIAAAVASASDAYAAGADVLSAGIVSYDGTYLRLSSVTGASGSSVVIDEDQTTASNLDLSGSASREPVSAAKLVGAIMEAGATAASVTGLTAAGGMAPASEIDFTGGFGDDALAKEITAASGAASVFVTTRTAGIAAYFVVKGSTALLPGTGLVNSAGDGASGEAACSGFVVTSSNPNGSGSANDSILSSGGDGSDGFVGQTYSDSVTGLTFTILPRDGGGNYVSGATATYSMEVRNEVKTDANNPVTAIPGLWTWVSNTAGVAEGDTVEIDTFKRGANEKEPANGQNYFVEYVFEKRNYSPRVFTRLQTVIDQFGEVSPDSPTSLASYLLMLNGGSGFGIKQVKRAEGQTNATESQFLDAIESLEGIMPGGIRPTVLLPLMPATLQLASFLADHCTVQSDIAHRAERTAILGFGAGTQPTEAATMVNGLRGGKGDMRIRFMYPDMMTVTTTDFLGNDTESLIDGRYLAVMMGARQLSANRDPATPWTGTRLAGTNGLARNLDAVSQNQVAAAGVTVCENVGGLIKVRHGLTSDMTDVLTKTPTVAQIIDHVQLNARNSLAQYIGVKFLPGVLSQIEGNLAIMFGRMMDAQIVSNYTGIKASVSGVDPTLANLEAYYQPVFPLLYIVMNFNLRSQG